MEIVCRDGMNPQSTAMQMTPARNATDAHAQDFLTNDVLILPILQALAQCTCSLHAARNQ